MKYPYHSTDPQEGPTPQQIAAWSLILRQWQSRLAPFFARPEVLHHALLYLQAILSDIPRKNGWQIAEHARQSRPYGIQRLLSRAVWDQDGVRDELRRVVCQTLSRRLCRRRRQTRPLSRCWSLMKVAFPNAASTPLGSGSNIAASVGASKTARWVSFSPTSPRWAMP